MKPAYFVHFSPEDDEYVATVSTEPFMSGLDPDPLVALRLLIEAMDAN